MHDPFILPILELVGAAVFIYIVFLGITRQFAPVTSMVMTSMAVAAVEIYEARSHGDTPVFWNAVLLIAVFTIVGGSRKIKDIHHLP